MVRQTSSTGEAILHHIDEGDPLDEGRPSLVAKNTLADRRISFAFSNSTICFLGRLISSCASDVVPGLCRHQYRRASSTIAASQDSPQDGLRHG